MGRRWLLALVAVLLLAGSCLLPVRAAGPIPAPLVGNVLTLSLLLLTGSISAVVAFRWIGSHVYSKGVLREPFFLLPTSVLLAAGGVATGGAALALRRKHRCLDGLNSPPNRGWHSWGSGAS